MQLSVLINELDQLKAKYGDMQVYTTPRLSDVDYDIMTVLYDKDHDCTSIEVERC